MGVVSGVVMSYQFGTNWSAFEFRRQRDRPPARLRGADRLLPEAGFLGIMLFGWDKVGRRAHFGATVMVAVGTLISMFWILSSNSWMQTPTGYAIVDGRVVPTDWFAIVFNLSFPTARRTWRWRPSSAPRCWWRARPLAPAAAAPRPGHPDQLRHGARHAGGARPLQALVGDAHGLNILRYQPAKIAAIEGLWETEAGGTALKLFGIPDMAAETTRYTLSVPHLGSLILTHSWDGEIRGLKDFPPQDRPDARVVFWSFRVMVGLGLLMILLAALALLLQRRRRLYETGWFHRFCVAMSPAGFVALLAGWITTEAGRQPWVVYGLLRTAEAASPVSRQQVGVSLLIFVVVYLLVFGTGIHYLLKLLRRGPHAGEHSPPGMRETLGTLTTYSGRRPLAGADDHIDSTPAEEAGHA